MSLTITYKLERSTDRFLNLVGPSLRNLAIGCPWPSMPFIVALWAQKVKRWNSFLVFSASQNSERGSNSLIKGFRVCRRSSLSVSGLSSLAGLTISTGLNSDNRQHRMLQSESSLNWFKNTYMVRRIIVKDMIRDREISARYSLIRGF